MVEFLREAMYAPGPHIRLRKPRPGSAARHVWQRRVVSLELATQLLARPRFPPFLQRWITHGFLEKWLIDDTVPLVQRRFCSITQCQLSDERTSSLLGALRELRRDGLRAPLAAWKGLLHSTLR